MVVCKYFLEGRCRFGDRCFNEHIFTDSQRYPSYQRSNSPNRAWNFSFNEARQSSNYQKYFSENENPYRWVASRYDDPHYAKSSKLNRHYELPKESVVQPPSKNRFEILRSAHDEAENKSDGRNGNLVMSTLKEDVILWEKGSMWPFTCYGPIKSKPAIPGLEDISPEELRYEAYEAQKNNTFPAYVKHVTEALLNVNKQRELLKTPTAEIINFIDSVVNAETRNDSDKFSTANESNASKMLFGKFVFNSNQTDSSSASSSGFFTLGHLLSSKTETSDMESMNEGVPSFFEKTNSQESSFKFVLPSEQEKKSVASEELKQESSVYTPLEELTKEEVEAFSAPTFTLGKIPTRPPARVMCF